MTQPTKPTPAAAKVEAAIAKLAAAYPEVVEENPWGHRAFKVKGKTFLFLGADGSGVSFSVKLPHTGLAALELAFTEPTHYGLGKSGWVTAHFADAGIPLSLVREWLDESYAAIAPKQLARALAERAASSSQGPAKRAARPAKRRAVSKKTARVVKQATPKKRARSR
jgi:predicted DNA-binding protein (MmcQ/YjbR family)